MGPEGIGPSASVLSGQRSTNELWAHQNYVAGQRSTNELIAPIWKYYQKNNGKSKLKKQPLPSNNFNDAV